MNESRVESFLMTLVATVSTFGVLGFITLVTNSSSFPMSFFPGVAFGVAVMMNRRDRPFNEGFWGRVAARFLGIICGLVIAYLVTMTFFQ